MLGYVRAIVQHCEDRPALSVDLLHHRPQLRAVALIRLKYLVPLPPGHLIRPDVHPVHEGEGEVGQPHGERALLVDADLEDGLVGEGAVGLEVSVGVGGGW